MEGSGHVCQLELDGLEAADGLPELLADSCVLLGSIQAEGSSPQAASPYVDAAPIHCTTKHLHGSLARHC